MSWFHVQQGTLALRRGGVVAYPTEAVYGLGCDPMNPAAVERLLALKGRPTSKGLILIAASFKQLKPFVHVRSLQKDRLDRIRKSWPGPVTWIMPCSGVTPAWITGDHDAVAVRVTDHPVAAALCDAFGGALVSTSANLSGGNAARDMLTVRRLFGDQLDYLIPGTAGPYRDPSEIRDARTGRTLRAAPRNRKGKAKP